MQQIIEEILANQECISKIENVSFIETFSNKTYDYIYKFIYSIGNNEVPITMGIPSDWERKLIDIYIDDYRNFKYIPHLDLKGLICLFDLEGVLIDKDFRGLISQSLKRLHKILLDGINDLNKEDFIEEFEQYWLRLPDTKKMKSMVSLNSNLKLIKYATNQKKVKNKKGDKFIDKRRKSNNYTIVCAELTKDFSVYEGMQNISNGIYIKIDSDTCIYPPDWREAFDIDYVNNLLKHSALLKKDFITKVQKCSKDLLLLFAIFQPNGYINMVGVIIRNYSFDEEYFEFKLLSNTELIPCETIRCDREYLLSRGGAFTNISTKKILVVGCGSIGGYLLNELVKTGFNNITIVDGDTLKEENVYRHLLGMQFIDNYKSVALANYFSKNIPNLNISSFSDEIEKLIDAEVILAEYDLIISAVGNHNLNRWLNDYLRNNNIDIPAIYLWNEVLGIGSHVAFIATGYKGCYECFIGDSEAGIYDKTSFAAPGQMYVKKVRGCGSSFLPFSSSNSLTTVILGIGVIRNYFEGRVNENFLVSLKGDSHYFEREGYKTSNRYNNSNKAEISVEGEKFLNEKCSVCGIA